MTSTPRSPRLRNRRRSAPKRWRCGWSRTSPRIGARCWFSASAVWFCFGCSPGLSLVPSATGSLAIELAKAEAESGRQTARRLMQEQQTANQELERLAAALDHLGGISPISGRKSSGRHLPKRYRRPIYLCQQALLLISKAGRRPKFSARPISTSILPNWREKLSGDRSRP